MKEPSVIMLRSESATERKRYRSCEAIIQDFTGKDLNDAARACVMLQKSTAGIVEIVPADQWGAALREFAPDLGEGVEHMSTVADRTTGAIILDRMMPLEFKTTVSFSEDAQAINQCRKRMHTGKGKNDV